MPLSTSSRSLECPECFKSFSRPSHLSRHQGTHLMPSHRRTIPCTQCDMTFSRRDVLLRHLRSAHQFEGRPKRSVQRSCFRCVEKKLKCGRTRPCSACYRSDAACEYPSCGESEVELFGDGHDGSEVSDKVQVRAGSPGPERECIDGPVLSGRSPLYAQQKSNYESGLVAALATPDSIPGASAMLESDRTYGATGPRDVFTGLDTRSTISSNADMAFTSFMPDMDSSLCQGSFSMTAADFPLLQPSFHTGGLDWLGVHVDDGGHDPAFGIGEELSASSYLRLSQDPRIERTGAVSTDGAEQYLIGNEWPTQGNSVLQQQNARQTSLPWPFEQGKDSVPHRYRLPPLCEVLGDNWRANRPTQPSLIDGFIHILSSSRLPKLTELRENNHVQAFHDLQRLVDLYFARFHDIQAIIHRPTWEMSLCPTVLLAVMACVGAMLSDSRTDTDLSPSLSDICSTMITWMGASDSTNYRDISYLNALCIHQIYSLGSGNRQLYQSADRSRGTLIGGLRGVGLLRSVPNLNSEEEEEAIDTPRNAETLDLEWRSWVTKESGRRAAWAAFEYDCSLCTLTSRRGIVDLSELPAFLPCADYIWSATSAQAWYALQSRIGSNNISPRLSKTLRLTLAGRELPSALGFWAKRLCSQVIGRLLWDLKQLEVMAMPEYCGLGSLISAHRDSKTSLLKGFNTLVEALSAPSSTSDLISYNITGLLCHYSHLYAANDVMDIIVYIVRNLVSSAAPHGGVAVARRRLKMALASDPQTSRRLCWHAAQIVVIANEYLVSAPCEILRVFMGYIFILAYSAYGPRESTSPDVQDKSVRLDLPDRDISQRRGVVQWIQSGGPASLGSVQDLCSDGCIPVISRDAQDMMQKLRCWGLADKFTRMFQVFETKGF